MVSKDLIIGMELNFLQREAESISTREKEREDSTDLSEKEILQWDFLEGGREGKKDRKRNKNFIIAATSV